MMVAESEITDYVDFTFYTMPQEDRRLVDVGDIFLNQIRCKNCKWIIRSKNRHHEAVCKCGDVSVDGGSWYIKVSGKLENVEYLTLMYADVKS